MAETLTLNEARLRAHEQALQRDPQYRRSWLAWCEEREKARERRKARGSLRIMMGAARYTDARLPLVRVWMRGPSHRRLRWNIEEDVRELVLDELRPGVTAMWSDPYEIVLNLRRS